MSPENGGLVEIGFCDVVGESGQWEVEGGFALFVNPGCSIDPRAAAVHQIVDEDLGGAVSRTLALAKILDDSVIAYAAHVAKFENWLPELVGPVICTYKCALRLWPDAPEHKNQTLRYWRSPLALIASWQPSPIALGQTPTSLPTCCATCSQIGAPVEQLIAWSKSPRSRSAHVRQAPRHEPWSRGAD